MTERRFSSPEEERLWAVEENLKTIREGMQRAAEKSGRDVKDIRFMAVTKTVEPLYINRAIELGVELIGENRVQEFLGKRDALHLDHCEKHLIGHLQTNKVRQIVGNVDLIQSVSSVKLAKEIEKCSAAMGVTTPVLLEVNIGREESKSGFFKEELDEALDEIAGFSSISIRGLMTIPPICENSAKTRQFFSDMYQTFIDIQAKKKDNISMSILSMGMSADYEDAIMEGSTLVRVGSALFGARIYQK